MKTILIKYGWMLCLLISLEAIGQIPYFQSYQLVRRKDPVQVNTLLQDKQGFLWIGTNDGLFRFDGRQYRQFTKRDSLPKSAVTALGLDDKGSVWVGFQNGMIGSFLGERFTAFNPEEGLSTKAVSDIHFDKKGNLWFGTLNDGLYYFANKRLYRLDEADGMPDLYIYDITMDEEGNILAGTDGGVVLCQLEKSKVSIQVMDYKTGLPDNIIRKIACGTNGKLWLATEDAGVIEYDREARKYNVLVPDWKWGAVSDFTITTEHLWAACPQHGLLIIDKVSHDTKFIDSRKVENITSVNVLLQDLEGNMWLGGKTGLFRSPGTILQYFQHFRGQEMVLATTEDEYKNTWYATYDGLFKLHGSSQDSVTQPLAKTPFEKFTVISLYTDFEGYVWAGLYGEGALRIHPVTGKVQHIQQELVNGNVLHITGSGNTVWLATLGGGSKLTINGTDIKAENIGHAQGLSSDFIYQILIDSRKRVWFATDGKGVDMMDDNKIQHFEKGLPSKVIYTVVEDSTKTIWVNVQGYGLYQLTEQGGFQALPEKTVMRESEIYGLAVDANGHLVAMHDAGLDVIDVAAGTVRYFGDESGLRDRIANLNAVSTNRSGELIFGTSSGLVKYKSGVQGSEKFPLPFISKVRVFDKDFSVEDIRNLSHDQDNITFQLTGLWFQDPESVTFSYMLENYDREWINTRNTSVTYSRLPPGSYTFKVRASATGSFDKVSEASATFSIHPPFWKTPPFYMVSIALLIVGGYGFMRFRERKLMQDKILLEAKVRRRTMEVQRQNDEIQAQNEEIMAQAEEIKGINENLELMVHERTAELERKNRALEEYAFINAHKLRSPVASILGLVSLLAKADLKEGELEITRRLKQSTEELDEIVRSITRAIEKGERDSVGDSKK